MKLDILAMAAHPDDAELSCGGTLIMQISQGHKVGILDLTRGEMGTRGTPEIRALESSNSSSIMGVHVRENLGFADAFFENNSEHQLEIIKILRKYQPEIVFLNAPDDRHPDHGKAAKLGSDACFLAGLAKIKTKLNGIIQQPWRPKYTYHYIQDRMLPYDFVVNISSTYPQKIEAIKSFKSQFYNPNSTEIKTYISDEKYFDYIEARALEFGHAIGVKYGEGFIKQRQLGVKNIFDLI